MRELWGEEMILGEADFEAIQKVISILSMGMKKVEMEVLGYKVTGYYVTDKQIRIDIVEL
jgi:hypothetical protein